MNTEPEDATLWPYALTLICADGPREFRFRIDPVPEPLPFGRIGEPSGCRMQSEPDPAVGMLVAERKMPALASESGGWSMPSFWGLCDFREVVAVAEAAAVAGLGRLGSHPSSYIMSGSGDASLLNAAVAEWTRWAGEPCDKAFALAFTPPADAEDATEGAADLWEARERERAAMAERLARAEDLLGQAVQMIDAGISIDCSLAWVERARTFARKDGVA